MTQRLLKILLFALAHLVFFNCNGQVNDPSELPVPEPDPKQKQKTGIRADWTPKELYQWRTQLSEGVKEVEDWFDHDYPLYESYRDQIHLVGKPEDLERLLAEKAPEDVVALNLAMNANHMDDYVGDLSVFTNLEYLRLDGFKEINAGLYQLAKLRMLTISNGARGKLSEEMANLKDLEYFESLFTHLELPDNIHELPKLQKIYFNNFHFDQPWQSIYRIPNLQSLGIKFNNPENLEGISQLKSLKTLYVDQVHPEIAQLNLSGLVLNDENASSYPAVFGNLKQLVAVSWIGNEVMDEAPEFIAQLKQLEYLEIRGAKSDLKIPASYAELENLRKFLIVTRPKYQQKLDHLQNIGDIIRVK